VTRTCVDKGARSRFGDILSSSTAGVAAGWGILALGGWGWEVCLSLAASVFLAGVVFSGRGRGEVFSGLVFLGLGLSLAYHFRDIIAIGGEDLGVAAVALGVALGGGMVALGKKAVLGTALVTLLLFYGAAGIVSRALVGSDSVCWIYEPHTKGAGRLVAAEPCYVVENAAGELQIVPRGHLGVLPTHPDASHAGKRAGPYRIVGVLEIGGTVEDVSDGKFAQLDFSMVSPGGGRGVGLVRNPLLPSI
jgi:hypothetical protein